MRDVSQFEANLIRILRCFVGQSPVEHTLPIILREWSRPRCLSRACVDLVQDALAKGIPWFLGRQGWHVDRFVHDENVVAGRLWERSPIDHRRLEYSEHTLHWLMWVTAENVGKPDELPAISFDDCTAGDAVLLLLAFARLRQTPAEPHLVRMSIFRENPLVLLLFPDAFAADEKLDATAELGGWFRPERAWLLEALQSWLRSRWLEIETDKRQMHSSDDLLSVGTTQQAVLDSYLDAADRAGRRDLSRFVMDVAVEVLRTGTSHSGTKWFDRVEVGDLRIADRQNVYQSGLVLLRSLSRFDQWNQSARTVGFYDDEYAASQLWKSDWEKWNGDSVCQRAREVVESLAEFRV